jgi:hypothetical protein
VILLPDGKDISTCRDLLQSNKSVTLKQDGSFNKAPFTPQIPFVAFIPVLPLPACSALFSTFQHVSSGSKFL